MRQYYFSLLLCVSLLYALQTAQIVASSSTNDNKSNLKKEECYVSEDGASICEAEKQEEVKVSSKGTKNATDNEKVDISTNCEDTHENCDMWSESGECTANPNYMLRSCRHSCKTCHLHGKELDEAVEYNRRLHHVNGDATLLEDLHGKKQIYEGGDAAEHQRVQDVITEYYKYMEEVVYADPVKYKDVMHTCKNRHELCSFWASLGECKSNVEYMQKHCAVACHSCHVLDFKHRCPINDTIPMALNEGDIDRMFTRILKDYQHYDPHALSMPNPPPDSGIKDGAWLMILNDFLTEEECDHMIKLGGYQGYKQSADVGQKKFDGTYTSNVNKGRTSNNAWCQDSCYTDPISQRVHDKMEEVTGIPRANYEYLQILRYEVGQFYQTHHDYIEHHLDRQPGVRTLTLYLYLNDVEEGGGTEFPTIGLEVKPKKGKAVLWPSVFNHDPNIKDKRTEHGALPVIKGIKYGANAWIHQRDFKEALSRKCV